MMKDKIEIGQWQCHIYICMNLRKIMCEYYFKLTAGSSAEESDLTADTENY